jgi:hypothetical protein
VVLVVAMAAVLLRVFPDLLLMALVRQPTFDQLVALMGQSKKYLNISQVMASNILNCQIKFQSRIFNFDNFYKLIFTN